MAEFVKVAQTNEIEIGQARLINLKGKVRVSGTDIEIEV